MNRNKNLDGVRGIAALSVSLAHCATVAGGVSIYAATFRDFPAMAPDAIMLRLWHSIFNGDAAVILFFALSGFVLGRSLEREAYSPFVAFVPYVIKRMFRLLPATVAAGLLAWLLFPITVPQMIGTMLIYDNSVNGVLWSLQVEVIGSILIFALWSTRSRLPTLALIAFYCYAYRALPHVVTIIRSEFTLLPAAFVMGYVIPWVPKPAWNRTVLIGGIGILMLSDLFFGRTWNTRIGQVIGAFIVVGSLQVNPLNFLNGSISQFLGDMSYSFYLIHPLLLDRAATVTEQWHVGAPPIHAIALATMTIPIALVIAWISSKYIENPGIKLGKRILAKLKTPMQQAEI